MEYCVRVALVEIIPGWDAGDFDGGVYEITTTSDGPGSNWQFSNAWWSVLTGGVPLADQTEGQTVSYTVSCASEAFGPPPSIDWAGAGDTDLMSGNSSIIIPACADFGP